MMEHFENAVRRFLAVLPASVISRSLSSVESHSVPMHSQSDRRKGGQFGMRLKKLWPYNHRLSCGSVYRQAFLWGTANYLKGFQHEELIIGFGIATGARTQIDSVMKIRGDSERVALPGDKLLEIHAFLDEDERNTVILVHNHPEHNPILWLLGLLLGDEPLPSLADRDCGLNALILRLKSKLNGLALGKLRFYLVQNDSIREFSGFTPALLLDILRISISQKQRYMSAHTGA